MDQEKYNPVTIFGMLTAMNALAGLAALLRSGEQVTARTIATATMNSAFMGLVVAFMWWHWFNADGTSLYFVCAVSLLAGLGGNTTFYFVSEVISRRFKIDVDLQPSKQEDEDESA